ncbi:unnamed protein product [Closterium sp. Naga37s-1]|nr:unnamed protein product [Closterium sp. Naga37s-1]
MVSRDVLRDNFESSESTHIPSAPHSSHLYLCHLPTPFPAPLSIPSPTSTPPTRSAIHAGLPDGMGSDVARDLQSLNLKGPIPDSISSLRELSIIYLQYNQLSGSIPATLGMLTNLNHISLVVNKLTGTIPAAIGNLAKLKSLDFSRNQLTGTIPDGMGNFADLTSLDLGSNQLTGTIPASMGNFAKLTYLSLSFNQLSGTIPAAIGNLASLNTLYLSSNQLTGTIPTAMGFLTNLQILALSHNYLTGPLVNLPPIRVDLSDNYLSGVVSAPDCQRYSIAANCFTPSKTCNPELQRPAAQCIAFCGISPTTAACGGRGVCYPDGPSLVPTCLCGAGFLRLGRINCSPGVPPRSILPPFAILTKGTKKETAGKFVAKPVTLFMYQPGVTSGCGLELAFKVNFTFALVPQSGTTGSNGFAFVIAAKPKAGKPGGVGYKGMGPRSMAVVFDTLQNDAGEQHVGLSVNGTEEPLVKEVSPYALTDGNAYTVWVDYDPGAPNSIQVFLANSYVKPVGPLLQGRVSLCAVLQPGVRQPAFSFGFVASTTVKPFQLQGIYSSAVQTGAPSPKPVQFNEQALGLSLSQATFAPSRASPFSRYVSADFKLSATRADSWSIRDFHTWDSVPFLNWPVKNQNDCNACWAYAVVASVEAAYGIAKQQSAPRLAVEALFALMGLSDSDKCSAGGSPTHALETLTALDASSGLTGERDLAFETLAALYASSGLTVATDPATRYPVQAFERAQFKGYVGLMLAVQRQPVVVHIEASPTFMQYDGDPGCYTGSLNHVVLVIGYFITRNDGSQNRIAPPFWIIRNSWGEDWGNRGHMRMDIQGGDGVCGINVLPGIYPIVKIPGDPCGQSSYKGDGDLQPSMNPCGRFQCQGTTPSSNNCTCNIPTAAVQPFVEVGNGIGSTCAYVDVCGSYFKNPCYVGACINDGKGAYSCICPPNHVQSTTVDGFPTCDPANTTATTMTVSGDNWWCSDVHVLTGLSLIDFTDQNRDLLRRGGLSCAQCGIEFSFKCTFLRMQGIDCSQPLPKGSVLQLDGTPATPCTAFFYSLNGDTCASISTSLNLKYGDLATHNPGLDCSKPIKAGRSVCLERSAAFAFTVPECVRFGTLTPQDTCEQLLQRTSKSVPPSEANSNDNSPGGASASENAWAALYRNNPGLTCAATIPSSASAIGSNIGVQVCLRAEYWPFTVGLCKKGRAKPVQRTMACSAAYSFYGGPTSTAIARFYEYNGRPVLRVGEPSHGKHWCSRLPSPSPFIHPCSPRPISSLTPHPSIPPSARRTDMPAALSAWVCLALNVSAACHLLLLPPRGSLPPTAHSRASNTGQLDAGYEDRGEVRASLSTSPASRSPSAGLTCCSVPLVPPSPSPCFPLCSPSFPPLLPLVSPSAPPRSPLSFPLFPPLLPLVPPSPSPLCSPSFPPLLPLISPSASPCSPLSFPSFSLLIPPVPPTPTPCFPLGSPSFPPLHPIISPSASPRSPSPSPDFPPLSPTAPSHHLPCSLSLPPLLPLITSPAPSHYLPCSLSSPPLLPLITSPAPSHYLPCSLSSPPLLPLITSPAPSHHLPCSLSSPPLLPLITSPAPSHHLPCSLSSPPLLPLITSPAPSHHLPCSLSSPPLLPLITSPAPSHHLPCSLSSPPLLPLITSPAPSHYLPCSLSSPPLLPLITSPAPSHHLPCSLSSPPLLPLITSPAPSHHLPCSLSLPLFSSFRPLLPLVSPSLSVH